MGPAAIVPGVRLQRDQPHHPVIIGDRERPLLLHQIGPAPIEIGRRQLVRLQPGELEQGLARGDDPLEREVGGLAVGPVLVFGGGGGCGRHVRGRRGGGGEGGEAGRGEGGDE